MRPANPDTHQQCRSYLQKAVRRGHPDLARAIARHLDAVGDRSWLRGRSGVIAVEECWPLAARNQGEKQPLAVLIELIVDVAVAEKNKEAAGLGTLAWSLSEGDRSVLDAASDDEAICSVCSAIERPQDYWAEAMAATKGDLHCGAVVAGANKAYRGASWPWDKAFAVAAAWLAMREPTPLILAAPPLEIEPWMALDRHTPAGRRAIQAAARQLSVATKQVGWASFYFESARQVGADAGYWWRREMSWRLGEQGLTEAAARDLWSEARPLLMELLEPATAAFVTHISAFTESYQAEPVVQTLPLF